MSRWGLGARIRGFVSELRRRRVPRVFIAYSIAAIAVAEGAEIFFPVVGIGTMGVQLVAVLAVLGLPVALMLAWAFDVVPDAGQAPKAGQQPTRTAVPAGASDATPAERWKRVQVLFAEALSLPPEERGSFLTRAAEGEAGLREEVLSLLRAHESDGPLEVLNERLSLGRPGRTVGELQGQTVKHYKLIEKLDDGGMGVVYKARDTRLDRTVALKFLSPVMLADRSARDRFAIEAQAAASLDHPNLCTIHEVGETEDGLHFIAMAYYEGGSLRDRIRRGRVGVDEALGVAAQICRGLARATDQQIIHRDVKPANIMFAGDGSVKIVDFGLARVGGGELTRSGALMGTVAYMSPEQTRGDTVDQRTDIWSIGVVLYEMLAGVRPFQGGNDQAVIHAILNTEPEPLSTLLPDLPSGVIAMVERALEKDPAHRYVDAATLLADIEILIEDPDRRALAGMKPRLPPDGERRVVTVLAGVVSGFDDLLDRVGESGVSEELVRFRAWIESVMEEFGGIVHEFNEHSVTVLFGVPVAHEDDGLRAVRSARQLIAESASERSAEATTGSFGLRFAVSSALVAVSRSSASHRPYRIGGSVIRDASLLAASGRPGDVLVAPDSARGVAPFLVTEERPAVSLSSDQPAVAPLAVLRETEVDSRLDASLARGLSGFVGRGDELSTLARTLDAAARGTGGIVSIIGDAGVGKSRLLHEFRGALADSGVRYVQGRCQSHRSLTPYTPFIECARAQLGLGRRSVGSSEEEITRRATALAPHLEAYAPVLHHLLSFSGDERVLGSFSAGEKSAAAVEVLTSLFTQGSGGQTLVLLLEDWHWADEGSQHILDHLAEMLAAHPVLVVVTSRREAKVMATLPGARVLLDLQPLDTTASAALARSSLGRVRVHHDLARHIEARTGGNPFFIEELCEHLVETGGVEVRDGEAHLAADRDLTSIPGTIRAVLKTRLDRLDPESREVLRSASVIGRDFGTELLSRVVPSPRRLEGTLRLLRSTGLIQRIAMIPEPRYRFKHALTLDVAYGSLLERQRRERHALVGKAIEDLHGDEPDEWFDPLARHFSEAGQWTRAVRYGMSAAARTGRLWRWREAVSTLEKVEVWMTYRADDDEAGHTLVDLLLLKEEYLAGLERREERAAVIERLEALVPPEASRTRATLLARTITLLTAMDRLDEAERVLVELTSVVEVCGARDERAQALRGMGVSLWRQKRYEEAVKPLTEVLEYARTHASQDLLFRDLWNLGNVQIIRGDLESATAIIDEMRRLEPHCSVLEQGMLYHLLGRLLRSQGDLDAALTAYRASSEKHDQVRLTELAPVRKSLHLLSIAALQVELGELGDAMETYGAALDVARRGGPLHLARSLVIKADVLAGLDRHEEAVPLYREAGEILESLATDDYLAEVLQQLAETLEATGAEEAQDVWRQVHQVRMEIGDRLGAIEAFEHQARLLTDPADRKRVLEEALHLAKAVADAPLEARIRNGLALLAWRGKDLAGACEQYEAAARQLEGSDELRQLGVILNGWGVVLAGSERFEQAEEVLLRALEANRAGGALAREADTLSALGSLFRSRGDAARATEYYERCVEQRRATEDRVGEAWALHRLAELARSMDDPDRGKRLDVEALSIAHETGDAALVTRCTGQVSGPEQHP